MRQFLLENDSIYRQWRERKLQDYPRATEQLIVDIRNPYQLTPAETNILLHTCQKTNVVIYRISRPVISDKGIISAIAAQLGLLRMDTNLCADQDSISSIQIMREGLSSVYVPYTNKSLNWHTDGYYNPDARRIRAFLMHCIRPASSGGENTYLDPEIIYILLRDNDPQNIRALMDDHAMTIPPNQKHNKPTRDEQTGPVFLIDRQTQTLHMRYTARSRNIIWKNDPATKRAKSALSDILMDNEYQFHHRLQSNEGVICNNVLHNRTAFVEHAAAGRLLYRARFYDRITATHQTDQPQDLINAMAK